MVAATSRSWEVTACEARRWALSGDRFTQPAWRCEAGTVTTPFPTKGRPAQGARVVCARARGQGWQDWNTRPGLHWSETRAWLLLLPRPEEEGTRGQRQAVGDPRARGGTRRQLWGGRLPCGSWQAGSPAGVRPCGTPRQLVPVSQEEAVGPVEPASPLPAATALTKGGRETRPRHQVTGRETSVWSLALVCTYLRRHPRDARRGWAPGGGNDSGHPCQPGAGGREKTQSSKWESKTRKPQCRGEREGDKADMNRAVGSGPGRGGCDRVRAGLARSRTPGGGAWEGGGGQRGLGPLHETGAPRPGTGQ